MTVLAICQRTDPDPGSAALIACAVLAVYGAPLVWGFWSARSGTRGRLMVTVVAGVIVSILLAKATVSSGGDTVRGVVAVGAALGAAFGLVSAVLDEDSEVGDFARQVVLGGVAGTSSIGLLVGLIYFALTASGDCFD